MWQTPFYSSEEQDGVVELTAIPLRQVKRCTQQEENGLPGNKSFLP
jgi:hypothetical protein